MKEYLGAVAYLDLLGIGALTRGEISLNEQDFESFGIHPKFRMRKHQFAAVVLVNFRRALQSVRRHYKQVQISQLSDSAFLWSYKPLDLLNAAREVMWLLTLSGVLCRGGLAYGSIVEPDKVDRSIGAFVLGDAATAAVRLERAGKGCRLFSDIELPSELSKQKSLWQGTNWGRTTVDAPFDGIRNPLDGAVIDEFRWYLYREVLGKEAERDAQAAGQRRLRGLVELLANLRLSPRFRLNTASPEGLRQIAVSIEAISLYTKHMGDEMDYAQSAEQFISHPTVHRGVELVKVEMQSRGQTIESSFRKKDRKVQADSRT